MNTNHFLEIQSVKTLLVPLKCEIFFGTLKGDSEENLLLSSLRAITFLYLLQ